MRPGTTAPSAIHASCVAIRGRAVLILGRSGAGKSALALELMSRGAVLVADDRVIVTREGDVLVARAPDIIRNRIEARGVGILTLPSLDQAPLSLVIDLDQRETARLPEPHIWAHLGVTLPCLHDPEMGHFPAAIIAYLDAMATGNPT